LTPGREWLFPWKFNGSRCSAKTGSERQKERYIPPLAKGEKIAAAAFTEPEHGSDTTRLNTTALKVGNEWVINGSEQFITNAPIADIFIILC